MDSIFFQNDISIWHFTIYTVMHSIITEYLKIYYLHYPSGMLEDWLFFAI